MYQNFASCLHRKRRLEMTKTLILVFHPDLSKSNANAALAAEAAKLDGVDVVNIHGEYPDGQIDMFRDGGREAERLMAYDHIVLQFPIQWYSATPLVQAWQNAVLTRMFYVHPNTEGRALYGKSFMVAVTAGNVPEAYQPGGQNAFTMEALLAPLMATAHRCGLNWEPHFVVYRADKLSQEELAVVTYDYTDQLRRLPLSIASLPAVREA
jgi:glutathione-regulated potassium-efflux system ancillary protein KefG